MSGIVRKRVTLKQYHLVIHYIYMLCFIYLVNIESICQFFIALFFMTFELQGTSTLKVTTIKKSLTLKKGESSL
jgi:hypothetical protein